MPGTAVAAPVDGIDQPVVTEYLRSFQSISVEVASVTSAPPLSPVYILRSAMKPALTHLRDFAAIYHYSVQKFVVEPLTV